MKFPLEHLARIFHFSPTSCVEAKGFISDLTSSATAASTSKIWFSIQNEPPQEQQTRRERNGRGKLWESQQAFTALKLGLSTGTVSSICCTRSPHLSVAGVFYSLRTDRVSSIFLKTLAITIDPVHSFYAATFPSFLHIHHKVSDNSKETTRLESAVFEGGLACTSCISYLLFSILNYWSIWNNTQCFTIEYSLFNYILLKLTWSKKFIKHIFNNFPSLIRDELTNHYNLYHKTQN